MNNVRGKNVMNFSDSRQNSQPPLQMHNFMPMPSSSVHIDHDQSEAERRASFVNQLKQNMQSFWRERLSEICEAPTDVRTPHTLPFARIKKVMKSDEKVKMISADTPVVFAKACELFVMELTLRAWMHTQQNKRKTVHRNDVAYAIRDDHLLAFLNAMVPMPEPHHDHVHRHHHDHQEADDVAITINHDGGVYVPQLPVVMPPPSYPIYLHTININQPEVAPRPVSPHDNHLAFPMNLHHHNPNLGFSGRNRGMQHINPSLPPPSPSDDGPNPYLSFKEFFQ